MGIVMSDCSYYVYFLIDPRDQKVFYIGKGKGKRLHQHAKLARKGIVDNAQKYIYISDIHSCGLEVIEEIKYKNLSESDAFRIEKKLIQEMREAGLTNISNGYSTNEGLLHEQCKALKSKLKSFNDWIASIGSSEISSVNALGKSPKQFYDEFVSDLDMIIQRTKLQVQNE
jgi:hypothetical protein